MSTGVLPWDDLLEKLLINTGFFETSQYTEDAQMYITAGNWDDAGLSVGNMQYNYGIADRASELFAHLCNNHRDVVQAVFGSYTTEFNKFIEVNTTTYTRADKVAWADSITIWQYDANGNKLKTGNSGHVLKDPWKDILGRLMQTAESKAKYRDMFNAYYLGNALSLFKQLNCTSRAALASILDLSINRGRYYPVLTLVRDFELIDADNTKDATAKEAAKIAAINDRGNDNTNGINVTTWVERRNCMRNQGGTYFGSTYDPETQFDINQEPAIAEKQAGFSNVNKLGEIPVQNLYLGGVPVKSLYLGANLIGNAELVAYLSSTIPDTQLRTGNNTYVGYESGAISVNAGNKVWVDVQNWVASKCYYTLDGTEPDTTKTRYYDGIVFDTAGTFTLKIKTYNMAGAAEATKTFTVTVAQAPVTTISPSATVQNSIPLTITLSTSEAGAAIKYKIGTDATERTYTGPFTVNQNTAGVTSTQIKITYWSVGATVTETAKTITYDTSGAVPAAPVVTATPSSGQVALSWAATANTTSYTVYRSTTAGTLGTAISQYQAGTTFTDTGLTNGTQYFYTVQAGNYGRATNSAQVSATPSGAVTTNKNYRYVRFTGYGDQTGVTTRLVELQALDGATNRLLNKTPNAGYAAPNGGTIGVATDGAKVHAAGYPLWWTAAGVPVLVYDLGATYNLDNLNVTGYSPTTDVRQTKFKVEVSKDNAVWVLVADYSANTTNQGVDGFTFAVPAS